MNEWLSGCAALASLAALGRWARAVPTRAWGEGAGTPRTRRAALAAVLATLALQVTAAAMAAGPAAAAALVPAAWMVLGWGLTLAMNQWPQGSLRWALRLGDAGLLGCALGIGAALLAH
ncbi:hypothetical protein [Acidovorax sp. NCPPB 4044]|uniref:hypothetical protein n=1 Tax=Acidovorax sp. NCPPB 4044 TaxID=2940490 RepID=UPI002303D00C|nr:hypothetical protein [Acidovorax sp. NCPPB 4044]MDA8522273.1 hypothetical protein [Acidovorax sp. NCPPB 4044]